MRICDLSNGWLAVIIHFPSHPSNPKSKQFVQKEFEIQTDEVMDAILLLKYNLKPRDILEILDDNDIKVFCEANEISTTGNPLINI